MFAAELYQVRRFGSSFDSLTTSRVTISEIKAQLPLLDVLGRYGHEPRPGRSHIKCPFHDDRTASMQVYPTTGTVFCRAGGCPVANRSLDVIDFVMNAEDCTKHEAIMKCKAMIAEAGGAPANPRQTKNRNLTTKPKADPTGEGAELSRGAVLLRAWSYMRKALPMASGARAYLESRGLDYKALAARGAEVGYQTGQMHHGGRRDEFLIKSLLSVGLLSETVGGRNTRSGGPAYRTFGKGCLAFALKDPGGKVAGLYFRRADDPGSKTGAAGRHYFLRDRRGLWPAYPAPDTRRLLVCESVIDAASCLQAESTAPGWSTVAMYGTGGWTPEHAAAAAGLEHLEEVCLVLDGDEAGRRATVSVAEKVRAALPTVSVTAVELPRGSDANGVLTSHGADLLAHLIEERIEVDGERTEVDGQTVAAKLPPSPEVATLPPTPSVSPEGLSPSTDRRRHVSEAGSEGADATTATSAQRWELDESDPYDLALTGGTCELRIKGLRTEQLDTLRVTVRFIAAPQPTEVNDQLHTP